MSDKKPKLEVGFPRPALLSDKPLTPKEVERKKELLQQCEARVQRNLKATLDLADALRTIKVQELWSVEKDGQGNAKYEGWEDYVMKRWKMSRQHCFRLIEADVLVKRLKDVTQGNVPELRLPGNERAYRALYNLKMAHKTDKQLVEVVKLAGKYAKEKEDIFSADVLEAAIELELVPEKKHEVFIFKQELQGIQAELEKLMKDLVLDEDEAERLKDILTKYRQVVARCPKPVEKPETKAKFKKQKKAGKAAKKKK